MKIYPFLISLVALLAMATPNAGAQTRDNIVNSLKGYAPGQGRVNIYQDPEIEALIGQKRGINLSGEPLTVKTNGYRVQVFAGGNSQASKNEAGGTASKVRELFPELKVYTYFNPPRWICRVGDFRTIEEADAMMRQLRRSGSFREVSIVRDQIIITL